MDWLIIFIFTTLNEAIIEYLAGSVRVLRFYLPLLSLAAAILLTFSYQLSLFNVFLEMEVINPFLDYLFSAFIIARLSNFLNDFVQKFLNSK